ncbi:ATP-dependent helicase/deoxyribonuclease subunit B [Zhongshania aliphaticivorans]|uniref:ATP-dependent helicase/deoxyribonuclease subunit B n=1 Tax=Zhongshania aliphaticivorans TaxID=1470434 RepID=A0A5S9PM36_9GAMM|nr:PD-(D/E)XK nuclease family protein [Zhongshania aliphaticivorans]CAA0105239.1 ATP-dependent helicase/deoxyribonuclease subunit B [Zhongshania aliphaticivorans]CAA0105511.1 ATP-dependent helicase/deoxyribonuclease subunit B [Zhongshania aliphaticivorans]
MELQELLACDGHSIVLMPSDASARQCRDRIARLRGSHDQAFIETVTVMPVDQWLAELWDGTFPAKQVLRPIQLLALARDIIEKSEFYPQDCLNSMAITRQFVDAFQLHAQYQLSSDEDYYRFSAEYQAFYHWRQTMQDKLDEQSALSGQQLPDQLCNLLQDAILDLPDQLVLSEDITLSPSVSTFIQSCAEQTNLVTLSESRPSPPLPKFCSTQQMSQECEAVVAWLLTIFKRGNVDGKALDGALVAILVPDMNRYRAALTNVLQRQFYPSGLFPSADFSAREPWVFESSETLMSYPLIKSAWDLISLSARALPLEQLSRILRSRFVRGWPESRSVRATLDIRWREYLSPETTLRNAISLARKLEQQDPTVSDVLHDLEAILKSMPARQLPSSWVRFFDQLLLNSGWPNTSDDDVVVEQCRRGFSQAMDVFRALDRQLGEVSHDTALSWLQHILSTKRFSVSRDWACPIRIMEYDDAIGLQFDATWIMGLDDNALPRRVEPSPFLPLELQRQAKYPNSDPGLCLQRDQEVLSRLLSSAPQVHISHSRENEAGSPLGPCTLLPDYQNDQPLTAQNQFVTHGAVLWPATDHVRPVDSSQRASVRGGTGLFKEYASSPFFAFLKYRLNLREFPEAAEGLDHRVQGILVHDTMEHVWKTLQAKQALDALSDLQLEALVRASCERALENPELSVARYGESLLNIEKERVISLVCAWMDKNERQRVQDFEVISTEQLIESEIKGIPLRLRMDRIDNIAGKHLVIDYKTGTIDGRALSVDNLSEPQLPIYVLASDGQSKALDGVMLAQLKSPDDLKIHMRSNWANSVVAKKAHASDVDSPEKWQAELEAWSTALETMAMGILAGNIEHDFSKNHSRGFSTFLLPLLRDVGIEEEAE